MAILKKAIEAIDPTPDKAKEITLALNLLFELAEQKKNAQEEWLKEQLRTAGTQENPSIPITNTLGWHSQTRAYVKDNAKDLVTKVTDEIKKFVTGGTTDIIEGVGGLVANGLEAILGAGSGEQSEMHSYFIVVEAYSIVRFDIIAWQRRIEATGITSKIENAVTFTAAKSSVDVNKITFNTFLQAYQKQLSKMNMESDKVIEFIKKSKEIFEILRESVKNSNSLLRSNLVSSNSSEPDNVLFESLSMPSTINYIHIS